LKELAREKHIIVNVRKVQQVLKDAGYTWTTRSQKRKYTEEDMQKRLAFATEVAEMTAAEVAAKFSMAMDGVILTMPPPDSVGRHNY
jgi:hypothetical protein